MKDRTLLVKLFYKNVDWVASFKEISVVKGYGKGCGSMAAKDLKKMIIKLKKTGF